MNEAVKSELVVPPSTPRQEQLEVALGGMIGLVQLLSSNRAIPQMVREAMLDNRRFKDALACFPDTNWAEYGL